MLRILHSLFQTPNYHSRWMFNHIAHCIHRMQMVTLSKGEWGEVATQSD
jgi:hypothetical protein